MIQKRKDCGNLTEYEVIQYVATKMPEYKQLHGGVFFVDKMPISTNGKILKREARDKAIKIYQEKFLK
jgi:4-coumarate--CoA ligase